MSADMQPSMGQPSTAAIETRPFGTHLSALRLRAGVATSLVGLFMFAVGVKPDWFGWDRSPVVGFVQIAVFLVGLAVMCLGGFLGLLGLWKGQPRTIVADIGVRLVSTGYVIAIFAGMADVAGMGSQPLPGIPYFGPWQATGVLIGEILIALGFLMLIPYRSVLYRRRDSVA